MLSKNVKKYSQKDGFSWHLTQVTFWLYRLLAFWCKQCCPHFSVLRCSVLYINRSRCNCPLLLKDWLSLSSRWRNSFFCTLRGDFIICGEYSMRRGELQQYVRYYTFWMSIKKRNLFPHCNCKAWKSHPTSKALRNHIIHNKNHDSHEKNKMKWSKNRFCRSSFSKNIFWLSL